MVVALVVSAVVVVALVVAVLRLRARIAGLTTDLHGVQQARDEAVADRESAISRTDAVTKERDDALERVTRSRRDAAEVANRLKAETEARAEVEAARDELQTDVAALRSELDEARAERDELRVARAMPPSGDDATSAEVLWALALREMEHTWRVSIALGADEASPFALSDDPFRVAVDIATDAAREEGGAAIELTWTSDGTTPPAARATLALAVVRDVIAGLATTAGRTDLSVDVGADAVEIRVDARDDDDEPMSVELPQAVEVEPGVARIS